MKQLSSFKLLAVLFVAIVTTCWIGAATAVAQESATVTGTISDETNAVLPGVTVTALNTSSGRIVTGVTSEAGQYEITGLFPGPFRITASLTGFSEAGRSITLTAGGTATVDFVLRLGALTEQITVTAAKGERALYEIPQQITVVDNREIEMRRPPGVQDALERTPNLRTIETNPLRARPQLRGLASSRVAIMVDGERLNNTRFDVGATGISYGMIEVNQVETMEVVAGAGSSLYGSDAMAGTINIITKPPRRPTSGGGVAVDLRGDLDFNSNSEYIKGGVQVNVGSELFAFRVNYSRFDLNDYKSGGDPITSQQVVELGDFGVEMANAVGTQLAQSYGVWNLPAGGDVPNAGATGYNSLVDFWVYPADQHTFRIKYMASKHENVGNPFAIPPFQPLQQINFFRDLDKVSLRYDFTEVARWMPRLSAGFYRQVFNRPQNDLRSSIVPGSSFGVNPDGTEFLTGDLSEYVPGLNNNTENEVTSYGFDLQLNVALYEKALYTTGVAYLQDQSRDVFTREATGPGGTVITTTGLKTSPDTDYKNIGWFNQLEWSPKDWLKLSGGFRVDNWKTEAVSSEGFPAGSEGYILTTALPQILENPGDDVNVDGILGVDELFTGGSLTTSNTVVTGNIGVTFLTEAGINPFFRFGTSYREPEVTVRYLIRNFGPPILSIPSLPNTAIEPERGRSYDFGVKVEREAFRTSITYFENHLKNFARTVFTPNYCIASNPGAGVFGTPFPPCVFTGTHQAFFFQRVSGGEENVDPDGYLFGSYGQAHFRGFELMGEGAIPLGDKGSLTPFVSLSWLKTTNDAPSADDITLIEQFYNRSDTPIALEAGVDDVPAASVVPFQGTFAARYTDPTGAWWGEYELRFANDIRRVPPETLITTNYTQYGTYKSLGGFTKHTIRGGYRFGGSIPVSITLALENLNNAVYFIPYQNNPAPGRAFVVGITFDWRDVTNSEQ
jgi:outer membrane receptor protein involved in Fe transport